MERAVSCEKCQDTGWVSTANRKGAVRCEHLKVCKLVEYGHEYQKAAALNQLEGTVAAFAEQFTSRWGCGAGALCLGPVGTGKTHLASAIANRVMQFDCRLVVFAVVPALLWTLQERYRFQSPTDNLEEKLLTADLLVLDDIGAEKPTEWTEQVLYRVVGDRYARRAPIVATANCSIETLTARVGIRTVDRLLGFCDGKPFVLKGNSRRWQKR